MWEAAIIGTGRSTPGRCPSRRRMRRWRRASRRWTRAFTRKPPGGAGSRGVNHLDCSLKPGGFRASGSQRAWGDAWLRVNLVEDEVEREAIAIVRQLRADGLSIRGIAGEMNRRGIPTKGASRWHATAVQRLLASAA